MQTLNLYMMLSILLGSQICQQSLLPLPKNLALSFISDFSLNHNISQGFWHESCLRDDEKVCELNQPNMTVNKNMTANKTSDPTKRLKTIKKTEVNQFLEKINGFLNESIVPTKVIIKVLGLLSDVFEAYFDTHPPKLATVLKLKEMVYKIVEKLSLESDFPTRSTISFDFPAFRIKLDTVTLSEERNQTKPYVVKVTLKGSKLKIQFPFSIFWQKSKKGKNQEKSVFLLQTIVWKHDFSNSFSSLFSFDIFNKINKEKLVFVDLPVFAFTFTIPKKRRGALNEFKKPQCQFWNKTRMKWQNKGCLLRGVNRKGNSFICVCNHLTEFRVAAALRELNGSSNFTINNTNNFSSIKRNHVNQIGLLVIIIFYLALFIILSISGKDKKKDAKVVLNVLFPKTETLKSMKSIKKLSSKTANYEISLIREIKTEDFELKENSDAKITQKSMKTKKSNDRKREESAEKLRESLQKDDFLKSELEWKIQDESERKENYKNVAESGICASHFKNFEINLDDVIILKSSDPESLNEETEKIKDRGSMEKPVVMNKSGEESPEESLNNNKMSVSLKHVSKNHTLDNKMKQNSLFNKMGKVNIRVSFMTEKKEIIPSILSRTKEIKDKKSKRESKLRRLRNFSFKNSHIIVIDEKYFLDSFFPIFSILREHARLKCSLAIFYTFMIFISIVFNMITLVLTRHLSQDNGESWVGCVFLCLIIDMLAIDYLLTLTISYLFRKIKSPEFVFSLMKIRGFFLQLEEVLL